MRDQWPKSLQATRDGVSSSAFADNVISPACLDVRRLHTHDIIQSTKV
jgi:hypothetical protein